MNGDYERIDQHLDDALVEDAATEHARDFLARWALRDRARPQRNHQQFLTPSPTPLTSITDLLLSWSRGEWLIIDSHSYHPDFYINWRLRKLVGAVMSGKVYKALGPDGEVYRVEGWETEHKEEAR